MALSDIEAVLSFRAPFFPSTGVRMMMPSINPGITSKASLPIASAERRGGSRRIAASLDHTLSCLVASKQILPSEAANWLSEPCSGGDS